MLIEWEMVGETQFCKRKTNSRYLFLPFKSIKNRYIMQLRYELFAINAHGVGQVVGALGSGTRFAGSMRSYAIFYDACNSLI